MYANTVHNFNNSGSVQTMHPWVCDERNDEQTDGVELSQDLPVPQLSLIKWSDALWINLFYPYIIMFSKLPQCTLKSQYLVYKIHILDWQVVNVHFYSSYLDSPVACSIPWNISYQFPAGPELSSLPGCFTKTVQLVDNALYMEHYFYFKIYDWILHGVNDKQFLNHSELI
jgi:hypothetical protein